MMVITKERLLTTLTRIDEWHDRINGHRDRIVSLLTVHGLKSAFNRVVGPGPDPVDNHRINLELDYLGAPKSHSQLLQLQRDWESGIDRRFAKQETIYAIQKRYGISGIEWEHFTIGHHAISYPWMMEELPWIESDMPVLAKHKERVARWFIETASELNLYIWLRRSPPGCPDFEADDWDLVSNATVLAHVALAHWCSLWGHETEISLDMGQGMNSEARGATLWFCASQEKPSL